MSRRKIRARRRRAGTSRAMDAAKRHGCDLAVRIGFGVTATDVRQSMQQTHDALIDELGDRRRSGVEWLTYKGAAAAREALDEIGVDLDRGEMAGFLERYPEGTLVVAMCAAVAA